MITKEVFYVGQRSRNGIDGLPFPIYIKASIKPAVRTGGSIIDRSGMRPRLQLLLFGLRTVVLDGLGGAR